MELVNGLTHLFGALSAIAGLFVLIIAGAHYGNAWHVTSYSIYGASLILLYTSSSLYHLLPLSERAKLVFRRIDHIMIFILIAGTYTPICLIPLRGGWGWSIFGVIWGIAIAGLFMKIFWIHAPRWLATAVYILMGHICLIAIYPLVMSLPIGGLAWLAIGGIFYTGGAVIYATKRPNPFPGIFGFHEIWHLFVLAGSLSHFWAIYAYVTHIK